jgi:hypothetical protein
MLAEATSPKPSADSPSPTPVEAGYYEPYAAFARTLRLWFIAYGIGGPASVLANDGMANAIKASGYGPLIAYTFFGAVGLQVLLAVVFKYSMWFQYRAEYDETVQKSWQHGVACWIGETYWLEAAGDLITLFLFGSVTFLLIGIFFG